MSEDLNELIRQIVREVLAEQSDKAISRTQAIKLLGISRYKFDQMLESGQITPINETGQPKFMLSYIQKLKNAGNE